MERQEFKFNIVSSNEPMSNDMFYYWLNKRCYAIAVKRANRIGGKKRQEFKFNIVSSNEPMSNDMFYYWLDKRYNSCKINVISREHPEWYYYLTDIGFNADIHVISEESLNILKNVEGHWFRCTPYFEPKSKAELFYSGFHQGEMSGIISAGFATPELVQMVIDAGWIYNVTAETTYFSVVNGYLLAKYQRIIGSRRICKIKD